MCRELVGPVLPRKRAVPAPFACDRCVRSGRRTHMLSQIIPSAVFSGSHDSTVAATSADCAERITTRSGCRAREHHQQHLGDVLDARSAPHGPMAGARRGWSDARLSCGETLQGWPKTTTFRPDEDARRAWPARRARRHARFDGRSSSADRSRHDHAGPLVAAGFPRITGFSRTGSYGGLQSPAG